MNTENPERVGRVLDGAVRDVVEDVRYVFDNFRAVSFHDAAVSALVGQVYHALTRALNDGRTVPDPVHAYATEQRARGAAMEMYAFMRHLRDTAFLPPKLRLEVRQLTDRVEGRE